MLVGWEAPNTPEISEEAWGIFTASKCNLLKTRLYHPFSVYERALQINPNTAFLLRPTDEGRLNADEQCAKARPVIAELLRRRYKLRFITWSEPDHIDGRYGGPQNRSGALEFRAQLWRFVLLLRAAFPTLRLVSPPLVAMGQVSVFDEICGEVYRLHDDIGRHLYWQHDNELSEQWGLRVKLDRQHYPNKNFVVAEIGDSSNDGKPESEWVWAAIRYSRIARCLGVLKGLGWVDAAAIFILPGTPEWRGFWPDEEAVKLISDINDDGEGAMATATIGNLAVIDLRGELPDEDGKMPAVNFTEKDFISIHHTVTPTNTTAKAIYDYHKSQGWGGIGYNFLAYQDGRIEYVGECNTARAAVGQIATGNRRGVHIAMVIDLTKEQPSGELLGSVKKLIANIQHAYGFFMPVVPHALFNSGSKWDTTCPSGWRSWWHQILRAVGE